MVHLSRARIRARVRRAAAAAEDEAHEGGELNLVPYLDVIVNTVIFLLATTASTLPFAQVHASAPRYPPVEQKQDTPGPPPGEQGLQLTVAISYSGFIVAGAGGVMRDAAGQLPTVPCAAPLVKGRCPRHDLAALTRLAREIKRRYPHERRVRIAADRQIPYRTVIHTMDALRGKSTPRCTGSDGCLFDRVSFATGVQ
jgi:biopolymer transport protein TolR